MNILKRFENLWVLKFGRRVSEKFLPIFLHDDEYFVIILGFFNECIHIIFAHPAAENIVIFQFVIFVVNPCGHLADVKVICQLFQPFSGAQKIGSIVGKHFCRFLF